MTYISSSDFDLQVRKGLVGVTTAIQKFGRSSQINASEDVWSGNGAYAYLTSAEQLDFSSTSASDGVLGSGLRTIEVTGQDGSFVEQTETLNLNGASNARTANSYLRGYRVKGTIWGSTGYNQGVITAVGAVSTGTTVFHIDQASSIGWGGTGMAIYTIPAGYTGYMTNWYAGLNRATSAAAAELGIWVRDDASSSTAGWRNLHVLPVISTGKSSFQHSFRSYPILGEKTDVRVMCSDVSTANLNVSAGFDITLVQN